MTFYEAALRVLEAEGRPLTFQEITEKSIQKTLLSHIGKTPEMTMLSRLLAMARRKTDRKVTVTARDTFALSDWGLPESPEALAETAQGEIREEDNLPPLRPAERHPEARAENVRIAGRGAERKRRRDDEDRDRGRRKKKFPPVPEVVFEILSETEGALRPSALAERARERELASGDLSDEAILTALLEDNQRRIDAGRRPQFVFDQALGEVSLERAGQPSEAPPLELQAAFAAALGIPMEGGRPVLSKGPGQAQAAQEVSGALAALKTAARDARRASSRALRRRLQDLDAGAFEKAVVKMLHALGFRELKANRRHREGPLFSARRREGSLELRYAIRVLRGGAAVDRKAVQDVRKEVSHSSAQLGLVISAGDLRGEARGEAVSGGALVFVWCGEGLADRFLEAEVGVTVTRHAAYELDDRFFDLMGVEAQEAQRRREERQRDKDRDRDRPRKERPPRVSDEARAEGAEGEGEPAQAAESEEGFLTPPPPPPEAFEGADEDREDEGEEGPEGDEDLEEAEAYVSGQAPGAPGQPGERKRRRRRRRGRRGRGPRTPAEGAQAQGEQAPEGGGAEAGAPAAPAPAPEPPPQAAPPPPPPSGTGEGGAG